MNQIYVVDLLPSQRKKLKRWCRSGKRGVLEVLRMRILLLADVNGPAWTDKRISEAMACCPLTVANVRRYFVERGFMASICRKKQERPSQEPLLDGRGEARLIALACGETPEGHARWTLRLLAQRAVELEIADHLSHESVRRTLKKTNLNPTKSANGSFPQRRMQLL